MQLQMQAGEKLRCNLCLCLSLMLLNFVGLQPKPSNQFNGYVCQICGEGVGATLEGELFVACNECAFPVCRPCYEYERNEGNQSCPQCRTRYRRLKGSKFKPPLPLLYVPSLSPLFFPSFSLDLQQMCAVLREPAFFLSHQIPYSSHNYVAFFARWWGGLGNQGVHVWMVMRKKRR